jgi:hypothetical protein
MSLEEKISELTQKIDTLNNIILSKWQTPVEETSKTEKPAKKSFKAGDSVAKVEKVEPKFTFDQVKAKALEKVKACGRDAVVAVLTKFGAEQVSSLKPEQYDAVMVEFETLAEADV